MVNRKENYSPLLGAILIATVIILGSYKNELEVPLNFILTYSLLLLGLLSLYIAYANGYSLKMKSYNIFFAITFSYFSILPTLIFLLPINIQNIIIALMLGFFVYFFFRFHYEYSELQELEEKQQKSDI